MLRRSLFLSKQCIQFNHLTHRLFTISLINRAVHLNDLFTINSNQLNSPSVSLPFKKIHSKYNKHAYQILKSIPTFQQTLLLSSQSNPPTSTSPQRKQSRESIQRSLIHQLCAFIETSTQLPGPDTPLLKQCITHQIHTHYQFYSIFLMLSNQLRDEKVYNTIGDPQCAKTHLAHQLYHTFLQHTHQIPDSLVMKILRGHHFKYLHHIFITKLIGSLPNTVVTNTYLQAQLMESIEQRHPSESETLYFALFKDGSRVEYTIEKSKLMDLFTQFRMFGSATRLVSDSKGGEDVNFIMHVAFHYIKNKELEKLECAFLKLERNGDVVDGSEFIFNSIVHLAMKVGGQEYAMEAVRLMIKHKIQLSDIALNRLLNSMIESEKIDEAIELYKDVEAENCKPNVFVQTTLIKALLAKHDIDGAIEFVEKREMNIEGSNLVIHYFTHQQKFQKAVDTFTRFTLNENYKTERSTLTLLLTSATTLPQIKQVQKLASKAYESVEEYSQVLLNEDHRWIDTLIHALGRCEAPEEAELLAKHYVKLGYRPSIWTFSSLIGSWGKCEEYERACKWYNWMVTDFGYIEKSVLVYNTLLHAVAKSKLSSADKIVEIEQWVGIMDAEVKKDSVTFNILGSIYITEGLLVKLEALFEEMKVEKIPIGMQTCLRMCQSYSRINDLGNALIWYKKLNGLSSRDVNLAWKSIMKLYETTNDLKGMLEFMETIKSHPQFQFSPLMVSQLSKLFVNLDMVDCLTGMIQNEHALLPAPLPEIFSNNTDQSPNLLQGAHSILLNYYCEKKEYAKGISLIQSMKHTDIDDYIPSIVMKLCSHGKHFEECDALWHWTNAQPHRKNTLISYLLSSVYQFPGPDNSTTSLYLDTLGFQKKLGKLEDTWRFLVTTCVPKSGVGRVRVNGVGRWPDENVYNSFIEALCRCDAFERAVEIFLEMDGSGGDLRVKATDKTARTLLTPLKKSGKKPELLEKVLEFCKKYNLNT